MIRSMTAFSRQERETTFGIVSWEMRAVNHRFLEIYVRLPEELRSVEPKIREVISASMNRGKIDCTLRFQSTDKAVTQIAVNEALLDQLISVSQRVQTQLGAAASINVADLVRWPGVVRSMDTNDEALHNEIVASLKSVLEGLDNARKREGEKLKNIVLQRCDAMNKLVATARARFPQVRQQSREKLLEKLAEVKVEFDPNRIEQELVIGLQKMDVDEELDRVDVHLEEVRRILEKDGAVGRRLDFLMQELNREANTLGSKSSDIELTQISVELKVLVEQMREQIQNIE